MKLPLTVSLDMKQLTITGQFTMRELNGQQRWAIHIPGDTRPDPSISLDLLRCRPDYDNSVAIAVFDFITSDDAESALAQLADNGYAYNASAQVGVQRSLAAKAQAAHRTVNASTKCNTKCKECGNSGWYEGFNVERERCSQGCAIR